MSSPKYKVGDVIYLRETAQIGRLESYKVSGIRKDNRGVWIYMISIPQRPPIESTTVGDRNTLKHSIDIELEESLLVTFRDACYISRSYLESKVAQIDSLLNTYCSGLTE